MKTNEQRSKAVNRFMIGFRDGVTDPDYTSKYESTVEYQTGQRAGKLALTAANSTAFASYGAPDEKQDPAHFEGLPPIPFAISGPGIYQSRDGFVDAITEFDPASRDHPWKSLTGNTYSNSGHIYGTTAQTGLDLIRLVRLFTAEELKNPIALDEPRFPKITIERMAAIHARGDNLKTVSTPPMEQPFMISGPGLYRDREGTLWDIKRRQLGLAPFKWADEGGNRWTDEGRADIEQETPMDLVSKIEEIDLVETTDTAQMGEIRICDELVPTIATVRSWHPVHAGTCDSLIAKFEANRARLIELVRLSNHGLNDDWDKLTFETIFKLIEGGINNLRGDITGRDDVIRDLNDKLNSGNSLSDRIHSRKFKLIEVVRTVSTSTHKWEDFSIDDIIEELKHGVEQIKAVADAQSGFPVVIGAPTTEARLRAVIFAQKATIEELNKAHTKEMHSVKADGIELHRRHEELTAKHALLETTFTEALSQVRGLRVERKEADAKLAAFSKYPARVEELRAANRAQRKAYDELMAVSERHESELKQERSLIQALQHQIGEMTKTHSAEVKLNASLESKLKDAKSLLDRIKESAVKGAQAAQPYPISGEL